MFCAPGTTPGGANTTTHPDPNNCRSSQCSAASSPYAPPQPNARRNNTQQQQQQTLRHRSSGTVAAVLSASPSTPKSLSSSASLMASANGTTRTTTPSACSAATAAATATTTTTTYTVTAVLPATPTAAAAAAVVEEMQSSDCPLDDGAGADVLSKASLATVCVPPPPQQPATPYRHDAGEVGASSRIAGTASIASLPIILLEAARSVNGREDAATTTAPQTVARRSDVSLTPPVIAAASQPRSTHSRDTSAATTITVGDEKIGEFVREAVDVADMPPALLRFLQCQKHHGMTSPVTAVPPSMLITPSLRAMPGELPSTALPLLPPAGQLLTSDGAVVKQTPAGMSLPSLTPISPTPGSQTHPMAQPPKELHLATAAGAECPTAMWPPDVTPSHPSSEVSTTNACTNTTTGATAARSEVHGTLELTSSEQQRSFASVDLECVTAMASEVSCGSANASGDGTQLRGLPSSERNSSSLSFRRSSSGDAGFAGGNGTSSEGRSAATEPSLAQGLASVSNRAGGDGTGPLPFSPSPPPSGEPDSGDAEGPMRQHAYRGNPPPAQVSATSFLSSFGTLVVVNQPLHKVNNPCNSNNLSVLLLQPHGGTTPSDSGRRGGNVAEEDNDGDAVSTVVEDRFSENRAGDVDSNASSATTNNNKRDNAHAPTPPPFFASPAMARTPTDAATTTSTTTSVPPASPEVSGVHAAPMVMVAGTSVTVPGFPNASSSNFAVSLAGSPPLPLMYPGGLSKRRTVLLMATRNDAGDAAAPLGHSLRPHSPRRLTSSSQRRAIGDSASSSTAGDGGAGLTIDSVGRFRYMDATPRTPLGSLEPSLMAGVDWMGSYSPFASATSASLTHTVATTHGGSTIFTNSTTASLNGFGGNSIHHTAATLAGRSVTRTGAHCGSPSQSVTSRQRRPLTATTQLSSASAVALASTGLVTPASIALPSPPSSGKFSDRQSSHSQRVPLTQAQPPQQQQQQQHAYVSMMHRSVSFGASFASSSGGSNAAVLHPPGRRCLVAMNGSSVQRHRLPFIGLGGGASISPLTDMTMSRSASPPPNTSSMATSDGSLMRNLSTSTC